MNRCWLYEIIHQENLANLHRVCPPGFKKGGACFGEAGMIDRIDIDGVLFRSYLSGNEAWERHRVGSTKGEGRCLVSCLDEFISRGRE